MKPNSRRSFRKLDALLFKAKQRTQKLIELIATHVAEYAEDATCEPDADRLEQIPVEYQVVYWTWKFQCEAGLNGFEYFILEPLGIYAPQIHGALEIIGATELVRRLEAAIPHALREGCAELNRLTEKSWFEQFHANPEFPTLQSVDQGVFPIIEAATGQTAAFVKAHENVFFDSQDR
jgi:hypothetical protein